MGWLDKGLKNIFKGGKDLLSSPAGIMALGVLAPYAAPWMKGLGATQGLGFMKSPMVSNALKNAAMNYGIATLTGSKHPEKSALWAGAASLPFTYMKGAQAAGTYNKAAKAAGSKSTASWADYALGSPLDPITTGGDITGWRDLQVPEFGKQSFLEDPSKTNIMDVYGSMENVPDPVRRNYAPPPTSMNLAPQVTRSPMVNQDLPEIGGYFTRDVPPGMTDKLAQNPGLAGMASMLGLENIDVMASLVPQVAGLYGGRMSEEEQWLASQEKQIRMWAFQFGIPYEEAKEIWKEGWKNPYYTTQTPTEYGDFRNRGGYIDDYTAGGKAVGPGTGKSDSIQPVALSNGEFVFTEEATNKFPGGADGLYSLMNRLDPDSETPTEARA